MTFWENFRKIHSGKIAILSSIYQQFGSTILTSKYLELKQKISQTSFSIFKNHYVTYNSAHNSEENIPVIWVFIIKE